MFLGWVVTCIVFLEDMSYIYMKLSLVEIFETVDLSRSLLNRFKFQHHTRVYDNLSVSSQAGGSVYYGSCTVMVFLMKKLLGKFSDILYRPVISDGELGMKVLVLLDVMSTYGALTAVHSQHRSSRRVSGGIFTMLWTYYTF